MGRNRKKLEALRWNHLPKREQKSFMEFLGVGDDCMLLLQGNRILLNVCITKELPKERWVVECTEEGHHYGKRWRTNTKTLVPGKSAQQRWEDNKTDRLERIRKQIDDWDNWYSTLTEIDNEPPTGDVVDVHPTDRVPQLMPQKGRRFSADAHLSAEDLERLARRHSLTKAEHR